MQRGEEIQYKTLRPFGGEGDFTKNGVVARKNSRRLTMMSEGVLQTACSVECLVLRLRPCHEIPPFKRLPVHKNFKTTCKRMIAFKSGIMAGVAADEQMGLDSL